jgi:DNA-binding NarL/FixJ family response regulator
MNAIDCTMSDHDSRLACLTIAERGINRLLAAYRAPVRAKGQNLGNKVAQVKALRAQGLSQGEIARKLSIPRGSVQFYLNK